MTKRQAKMVERLAWKAVAAAKIHDKEAVGAFASYFERVLRRKDHAVVLSFALLYLAGMANPYD